MEFMPSAECERVLSLSVFHSSVQFVYGVVVGPEGLKIPFKNLSDRATESLFVNLFLRECVRKFEICVHNDREARAFLPRFDAELISNALHASERKLVRFDINNKGFIIPPDYILSIQNTVDRALQWRQL